MMRGEITQHGLDGMLHAIAGEQTYEGVLAAIACKLGHVLPFDHIDIVMLVAGGRNHICFETPVRTIWSSFARAPQPTGLSPVRSVLNGALPYILTDDAFADERFHFEGAFTQPIFQATLRSRVIVPLKLRDMVFGSISISKRDVKAYDRTALRVGRACAKMVAPYLFALMAGETRGRQASRGEMETLRSGLLNLAEAAERDRRRLGMDLHDQTIGDLSRIARRASGLKTRSPLLRREVTELRREIAHCLAELRRIVDDALPAVLELFGFAAAVEETLRRSQAGLAAPMCVTLRDHSDGAADRLAEVDRVLLYRIVQEAVNNAVKHSRATRLEARIGCDPGRLEVEIEDDGCGGVDETSPRGVSHMRSRAALIGARLRFGCGREGRGTRVSVQVPLGRAVPLRAQ